MERERPQPTAEPSEPEVREDGNGALDDAVESSFPASDPIAAEDPGR